MSRINTPVNQKRLTNVSVMRLKKTGLRFEIACYPNKVQEWQKKIETDLDEVLQILAVFSNVSKGIVANDKDLLKTFGTINTREICLLILQQGELQVSQQERKGLMDNTQRDIATLITQKCINIKTNKPFTIGVIENALSETHFKINSQKTASQQLTIAIKHLQNTSMLPIERIKLRIKIILKSPTALTTLEASDVAKEWIVQHKNGLELDVSINPSFFRYITDLAKTDGGSVMIIPADEEHLLEQNKIEGDRQFLGHSEKKNELREAMKKGNRKS